jgi:uncharacterized membrane protein YdjX (TVP38/TMEM64 family)
MSREASQESAGGGGRFVADRRLRLVVGLSLFLVVAAGALLTSPAWVLSRLDWLAADPLRFVAALLLLALVRPLLAWPTTLLAVVVGYGWGVPGLPAAVALITLTSVPPYWFARRSRAGGRFSTAGERAVKVAGGFRGVTASRLIPAPSDVVSIAAGLANVRLWPFVAGTAVGELPWAVAGVVAGESIETVLSGGLGAVVDVRLVAAALVAAALLLAGPAYRVVRSGGGQAERAAE